MTVRFKCKSEYQRSFGVSRSRSVSPQRCVPWAGLPSQNMGMSREPGLQHRKRPRCVHAQSCSSLLFPQSSLTEPPHTAVGPTASRNSSAHRKESLSRIQTDTESPARLHPAADPPPLAGPQPDPAPSLEPGAAEKSVSSVKPRPSKPDSQPQLNPLLTATPGGQQPSASDVPHCSSRSTASLKKHTVSMETEYSHSFQGLALPTKPRPQKHRQHQRSPLFHITPQVRQKPGPREEAPQPQRDQASSSPPPRLQTGHRIPEGGHPCQAKELRQQALVYRRRAWGGHFSRDHLSQLRSEHNALWEPTDTTDSGTDPPTQRHDPDSHSTSPVEALDLASCSSNMSSVTGSGNKNTHMKALTSPLDGRRTAWEEEEEEENLEEEEGRLPTPRPKIRPFQRTHFDLTTPGGAILVGKMNGSTEPSPQKQRCGSAVSMTVPVNQKEACVPPLSSSGPKITRTKQSPPPHVVDPQLLVPSPYHCIRGTLRHADFQHNGELGLRFRELQCSGGCGSDEDDRLSVMSWCSAASCSMAAAVLERAQRRRRHFWEKR